MFFVKNEDFSNLSVARAIQTHVNICHKSVMWLLTFFEETTIS